VVEPKEKLRTQIKLSVIVLCAVMAIIGSVFCTNAFAEVAAEANAVETAAEHGDVVKAKMTSVEVEGLKFVVIAASIAFGLGAIGAGLAISHVGAAAMGAVAEKPEIAGQALIFVALAEGIVVFGFITALMILGKVQ